MTRLLLVLVLLTGCASTCPTGFECDPSGARWPSNLAMTKTPRYIYLPDTNAVELYCPPDGEPFTYACTVGPDLPSPLVVLPARLAANQIAMGWTLEGLRRHEDGHAMGVTRHAGEL